MSSVVYFLAKHRECQERARGEVLNVLGENEDITAAQLSCMPFFNACIRETMRLNGPSVATIPRLCDLPIRLGGHLIPPNVPITLNLYGILHNDEIWTFPDEFRPDRWLSGDESLDIAWMPFGTGPRRCPAANFSLYEQRTLLAMLLRKYEWTLPAGSPHQKRLKNALSTFALNLPDNLYINFKKLAAL